jgi:hypothetical protein
MVLMTGTVTAVAHDGEHNGPGSSAPTAKSPNMKLLSNTAKSSGATQSDLAFFGKYAVAGNYTGFRILDVSDPEDSNVVTDFACNGAQGDVSVMGNLLFQSVDTPQSSGACDSTPVTASTPGMFEGIRIFDISDISAPVWVASIQTDCGSHTHTLLPEAENNRAIIYVSSYPLGGAAIGPDCRPMESGDGHNQVSIVNVPLGDPAAASVTPYYLDPATSPSTYLGAFTFKACHDISVFKELKLAAAACLGESQLWDISDPLAPQLKWSFDQPVVNPANIDLWHSATFSWDGEIVTFGDESGGGTAARCVDPADQQGRIWFLDTDTGALLTNYKIPRSVSETCTMHNFNFIPLRDRNVLVSSSYTGGTTVVDVDKLIGGATESESEVGFYQPHGGNAWSSYWYNGFIYANDIVRGVDVYLLSDRARAGDRKLPRLNPQTQESVIN